jgi:hypothetical protein
MLVPDLKSADEQETLERTLQTLLDKLVDFGRVSLRFCTH